MSTAKGDGGGRRDDEVALAVPRWAALLRRDASLVGMAAYVAPPLALLGFAGLGVLAPEPARLAMAGLETGVPLAAGIVAASVVATDPALELQLSVPGGFRPAAVRRLAAIVAWAGVVSAIPWGVGAATGLLGERMPTAGAVTAHLAWLAPLVAFTAAGALLALVARSRAFAAAVLSIFWVIGHAAHGLFEDTPWLRAWYPFLTTYAPHEADWLVTRLTLLGIGLAAAVALWLGLTASEWILGSEDA